MPELHFRVLGPLEVVRDGQQVTISAPKLRVLLAALLLRANTTVTVEKLGERLWGDSPPPTVRKSTQLYALRLRRMLGDGEGSPIETRPDGYLIRLTPDQLDLLRFQQSVAAAKEAGDLATELARLDEALACWRGPALGDVPSESLQRDEVASLSEELLRAQERRMQISLELGRHREIIGDLVGLTGEHPWKESFWAQLIVALHHSGRSADALDTYQNVRRMFVDELGVEPGPQVQQAHRTVLAGGADGGFAAEPAVREAICQLPADVHSFVGRTGPIEMLNGWFGGARHRAVVISGPPGVGKTALAVHVGHLSRPLFPDGQLYVNLQGYSGESPMTPAAALIRFLGALGVPQNRVPADVEGQAALFRSVLADRKMLVLLDNALDADQVRPLLPGEPGCAVLITSRNDLRGLAVRPGVDHLPLGVLTGEESHAVLTDLLGTERAESELEAVTELARTCAHLPLALRIVGANLAADPHRDVEVYTEELKKRGRLSELAIDGDEPSAVRIAFDQSYLRMRAGDRGLFRLLGLVSGPDIGETAAAALAGVTPYEARRSLDRLAAANLLHRHAPGRYQLHDLIREYAADRARA
ncbi:MAG TPA: BTAD domain-containing putative transcriptional regulator, partial [Amycolatopsis sp.]|nr:BTAD domain-containing putative transcriptional regulator [Amycolatopsis sp.]